MNSTTTFQPTASATITAYRTACQWLERFPISVLELAFRVGIAGVFWTSGMTKTATWDQTVALFRDEYKVPLLPPEVAAYLATTTELVCAALLALGIAARFGAAALLGMTLVIQVFVYPANWLDHLLWAGLLGYVLTRGAGLLSIDHVVSRWWAGK